MELLYETLSLINWSNISIDLVYIFFVLLGFGYTLIQLILGGIHGGISHIFGSFDMDVGNIGLDMGGHEIAGVHDVHIHGGDAGAGGPSPINSMTIANFVTFFGAIGIIGRQGFGLTPMSSILVSSTLSIFLSYVIFWLFVKFLFSRQGSSIPSINEYKGIQAEVLTPISADGFGEIAYVLRNSRMTSPAKSFTKVPVKTGDIVQIYSMIGTIAYVIPFDQTIPPEAGKTLITEERKAIEDKRMKE